MAEDIVVRYIADVDELLKKLDAVAKSQEGIVDKTNKGQKAIQSNAEAQKSAAAARMQLLEQEKRKLEELQKAQQLPVNNKAIDEYNRKILESEKRIAELSKEIKKAEIEGVNSFKSLAAGVSALFGANVVLPSTMGQMEAFIEGINEALKEAGVSSDEFGAALKGAMTENGGLTKTVEDVTTLRTQLLAMKNELASGNLSGEEFEALSVKAAELEKKIKDVNLQVKNMASETATIDGIAQSMQGLIASFQLAEGAAAMMGVEAEKIARIQLQLIALLNISNGLERVQLLLRKESAAILLVTNAQRKIQNLLVLTENGLQSKNVIVKGAATAAQWLLNAAMSANPAGILVVALGALASALIYFTGKNEKATVSQKELNESLLEGLRNALTLEGIYRRSHKDQVTFLEEFLALRKAQGAGAIELASLEKDIADEKLADEIKIRDIYLKEIGDIDELIARQIRLTKEIKFAKSANRTTEDVDRIKSELEYVTEQISLYDRLKASVSAAKITQIAAAANLIKAQKEIVKATDEAISDKRTPGLDATIDKMQAIKAEYKDILRLFSLTPDQKIIFELALETGDIDKFREAVAKLTAENPVEVPVELSPVWDQAVAQQTEEEWQDFLDSMKTPQERFVDDWNNGIREIAQGYADLLGDVAATYAQYASGKIEEINRMRDAELEAIDASLEANEVALDKRRISEREAEETKKKLLAARVQAEEEAAKKERALKRKQFNLDKAASIAQIGINLAEAFTKDLSKLGTFGLILAYATRALGAIQLGIALAQPNPYKKGTKRSKSGLALVGEEGPELTYLPQGAKVLPKDKTNRYSEVIDAMYDGKLDEFIKANYMAPALRKEKAKREVGFAANVARAAMINPDTGVPALTYYDMEALRKKGTRLTDDTIERLADALSRRSTNYDPYRR